MTFDFEARHIIEALRSGIPSRSVGQYFSESRPQMIQEIVTHLDLVREEGLSTGMIISGKYGEGKTHLLNTVFNLAQKNNMVVSTLSLSKETPLDKLYLVYQKLVSNTYLPGRLQPGFSQELSRLTPNGPLAKEMLLFAAKQLETDRLYYLLRSYLNTDDQDEQFQLQTDLEGDFIANLQIKKIYRRIFQEKVNFNVNFVKTKHCQDYFTFLSHFFKQLGYNGWVILFDESELMGRLSKQARMKAYFNMAGFLFPRKQLESTFSMFAFSASYSEDVIEAKGEFTNLASLYGENLEPINSVLNAINQAPQLDPLTNEEIHEVLEKIIVFHGKAYNWQPQVQIADIFKTVESGGYLLRSKIRTAIEYLDQLHLYGKVEKSTIAQLSRESFMEDGTGEMPVLNDLLDD
ncbi:MAG: DUF2791 family P-loop domain-containing protein [Sphaerochaeta sp.]|nr:DUF2791 family P-loop domain-containing protein [Sphaerochaeta sp.]